MTVFEHDYLAADERAHPARTIGDPAVLTKGERLWMTRAAEDAAGRRAPSFTSRVLKARDLYKAQTQTVADALLAATVACPPPKRQTLGQRRGSGPSDPALAQITATHDAIDRGLTRFGHLLDDCLLCGDEATRPHNDTDETTLGRLLDDDWTEIVDHLTGISATSPKAVTAAVTQAREAHQEGAERFVVWFAGLHQGGAESDVLANLATKFERQASRMRGLADSLAQWTPPNARRCAAGCGGHAPVGSGATCGRCRQAKHKAARAG